MYKKDFYFNQAKLNKYRSRSAYKIKEILQKFSLLQKSHNAIELGAAPGGWTQVLRETLKGNITAIDIKKMHPIANVTFDQINFHDFQSNEEYDIIFSDMSPSTTGDVDGDHYKMVQLALSVLKFTKNHLIQNGHCLLKTFSGTDDRDLLLEFKTKFKKVKTFKPKASKQDSREYYLIALYTL